ncbi:MAG TPA: type II toxin-antitoxin system RelE/ParE family toxin [Myxococcota bacterium]
MIARLTPEAAADVREARAWYASLNPRLARDFMLELDFCVSMLERSPELAQRVDAQLRRALLRRFPYGVFYVVEVNEVVVLACLHGRRSPTAWRVRTRP